MKNLILTGKITAASSFVIGTLLLAVYLYFDNPYNITQIGLGYIIITFWINLILLVILIISAFVSPRFKIEILKTCGIMLLNIPIAYGYLLLVIWSLDSGNTF
ncbi:hypothetical protein FG167_09935 [Lacinutrix sp. WUR7]|uniref:hypothetical protein n=1 Tax=Lacinutrix sp. WUR7 TaxID=2653681 RepID=UPI00193DF503|nr:hypothetical protein [Lacinutrix sp. WUR7]QRM89535.1 hypothetical protein FG167_09935 [Lacinutrix sp. WUR7]